MLIHQHSNWLVVLFFLAIGLPFVPAQESESFKKVDQYARNAPDNLHTNLVPLTHYLIEQTSSDLEKVRSIYTWITHNISYDTQAYKNGNKRINKNNQDILNRKTAVCFGYSTLFQEMTEIAGLSSRVIAGYSKGTLTASPDMEEPDHAWNAVNIEGKWYLLDATWGASLIDKTNDFIQAFQEGYFLTTPTLFVLNHLPADPMWQLLECPITPTQFQQSVTALQTLLSATQPCFHFQDSIQAFLKLPKDQQRLKTSYNQYDFNPTTANKRDFGHTHIDLAGIFANKASIALDQGDLQGFIRLSDTILFHCEQAYRLVKLYDWQQELYVNTLLNKTVAQSKLLDEQAPKAKVLAQYQQMLDQLSKAKELLDTIPETPFRNYAIEQYKVMWDAIKYNRDLYIRS